MAEQHRMTLPQTARVTRIATVTDIRAAATILARQNGRVHRAVERVEARLATVEAKLDRLLAILQALSAAETNTTHHHAPTARAHR